MATIIMNEIDKNIIIKVDYKMMRESSFQDCRDYARRYKYAYNKLGRMKPFTNLFDRSYTGPTIYQPKTLKERLGDSNASR